MVKEMSEIDKMQNKLSKKSIDFTKKKYNHIFNLFLFFYLILGFYFSVNTGIATDEPVEQYIWKLNVEAVKDFFGNNENGYFNLFEYNFQL